MSYRLAMLSEHLLLPCFSTMFSYCRTPAERTFRRAFQRCSRRRSRRLPDLGAHPYAALIRLDFPPPVASAATMRTEQSKMPNPPLKSARRQACGHVDDAKASPTCPQRTKAEEADI